jgi:membrane protein implicated in regulation of membrane protease activity
VNFDPSQGVISYRALVLIPIAAAIGVTLLIRSMRRLRLRAQFMVLLILAVSIGFIFLIMVQMPEFPEWLGVLLLLVVFIASLFGTRIFLRSVAQDEKEEDEQIRKEDLRGPADSGFPNIKPTNHTL